MKEQHDTAQAASSTVLKAIREANMQLVRTGDDAFMLVPYKVATAQSAESVPAVSDLPPLPDPDLRDVGTKPQEIKDFLNGYATEYARLALAARAPADSVPAKSYAELEKKHSDFVETAGLMLEAVGHTEDYARQWPKEKASITFKRWFDEQLATRPTPPAMDVGEDAEQERPVQRMEGWTDTRYIAELENVVRLLRRDREKLHRVRDALSEKGGR